MSTVEEEIDLLALAKYLFHYVVWIVAIGAAVGVMAAVGTKLLIQPAYEATSTLYVYSSEAQSGAITSSEISAAQDLTGTYKTILESDSVLDAAISKLGDTELTAKDIREQMTVEVITDTQVLSITCQADTSEEAQQIANTVAEVSPVEIVRITKAGGVEVVDYAKLPTEPCNDNLLRNTAIGVLLGMFLTAAVLVIKKIANTKIVVRDDLKKVSDLPLSIISAGNRPPNPSKLLFSVMFKKCIGYFRQAYDYVILDLPPVGVVPDAVIAGHEADGVIYVVKSGEVNSKELAEQLDVLQQASIECCGFVLNAVEQKNKSHYGKYNSYYNR